MVQKQRETEFFGGRLLKLSPIPASVPLSSPPATPPPTHTVFISPFPRCCCYRRCAIPD